MNETVSGMNNTMWIFAVALISMVIIQAVIFLYLGLKFNRKNNLVSSQELKSAFRTGAISALGPSMSTIVVALSLITMMGSAATFMRCGVIGSPATELFMAKISSLAVGIEFNSPEFTSNIFVLYLFGMTFASVPFFLITSIALKPLDIAVEKAKTHDAEKKESFMPVMGQAAMIGIIGYTIVDYLRTPAQITAVVVAASVSFFIIRAISKNRKKWLGDWNMAVSMAAGMFAAQVTANFMG